MVAVIAPRDTFIQLTIFINITSTIRITREDIFRPVVIIQKFKDKAEAIKIGNNTAYSMYLRS